MKRHRLYTSLLQVLGPASQIPSPVKVSNMANGRVIICLDLPRTVSIYAKKDNHSCSQPAHIFWTHLALPLLLPALQPHWPASSSSKQLYIPQPQLICIVPSLKDIPLSLSIFFSSYLFCSLSSNITSSERSPPHSQTGMTDLLLHMPLCFFHSIYNRPND